MKDRDTHSYFKEQFIPLTLTIIVLLCLTALLYVLIYFLNILKPDDPITLAIRWSDVVVGFTIYLKTAIDFAIFMGRLMEKYPTWKHRIAIEIGTALGNALGTMGIIVLWEFFRGVELLLALMVFVASLVLLELAHGSLHYFEVWQTIKGIKNVLYMQSKYILDAVYNIISPLLSRIMPDIKGKLSGVTGLTWFGLINLSFSVPFILGLDDFAGYVPLFSVVNVFGFSLGVFVAHTLLNIALFLSPSRTTKAVKNEYISFMGMLAFVGIAIYGFYEVVRIVFHLH